MPDGSESAAERGSVACARACRRRGHRRAGNETFPIVLGEFVAAEGLPASAFRRLPSAFSALPDPRPTRSASFSKSSAHSCCQSVRTWISTGRRSGKDDHVNRAITVHRSESSIDDLGRSGILAEHVYQLLHDGVLTPPINARDDPHPGEILNALQPGSAVAAKLLQDRASVLDPRRRPQTVLLGRLSNPEVAEATRRLVLHIRRERSRGV